MKGYRRQLFLGAFILEGAALSVFLCACLAIAFAVAFDNMASSYEARLRAIDEQASSRIRTAEEFVRIAADQEELARLCRAVIHPENTVGQRESLEKLRTLLTRLTQSHPQFQTVFVLTRSAFITPQGYFNDFPGSVPGNMSDTVFVSVTMDVLERVGAATQARLKTRNVLHALIDSETALVAILPDGKIFPAAGAVPFRVTDKEGRIVCESGESPPNARELVFVNPQTALRYAYLLDTDALLRRVWLALREPMLLATALGALTLAAIALLTGWVMAPFQCLARAVRDYAGLPQHFPVLLQKLRSTRSFQGRAFLLYCLGLLPMLLSLPAFTGRMESCIVNEMTAVHSETVELNARRISENVGICRQFVSTLVYSDALRDLMAGEMEENSPSFSELLLKYRAFQLGVREAALYGVDGARIACTSFAVPESMPKAQLEDFRRKYAFCNFYPSAYDPEELSVVAAVRNVRSDGAVPLFSALGYLSLRVDGVFSDAVEEGEMGSYSLYDRENWRLIATPAYRKERALVEGMCQGKLLSLENPAVWVITLPPEEETEDRQRLMFTAPVEGTAYTLICALPFAPLRAFAGTLPAYVGLFSCAFILMILAMDALFSRRVARLSRRVEDYFNRATPTSHDLPAALMQENEVTALAHAFWETMERISQLNASLLLEKENQARLENRRRQAEVIALQSQMDSHLIGNIFASMKLLIAQGDYAPLRDIVEATGNFLRSGLLHDEYDVPLQREIDHVSAYVAIQSIRFGSRLAVAFGPIAPALRDAMVPKYLLQPLIENAIIHGMRPRSTLHVRICIQQERENLRVEVANDGIGMTREAVDALNRRLREGADSQHIGLINVAERVRLRFGESYGLRLESEPDGPTQITILLPLIYSRKEEGYV